MGDSTITQIAATGGSRGAGMAALAKMLAVCAGTVGGAAACAATGVIPAPLALDSGRAEQAIERRSAPQAEAQAAAETGPTYEPEVAPEPSPSAPPSTKHEHEPEPDPTPVPVATGGAVEYTPPPPPAPAPSASASSSGGSAGGAAGEFGP